MTEQRNAPGLHLYTKIVDGRKERIGSRIGVGFKHKDGEGYNFILDAQPIPHQGRLYLVAFEPSERSNY